MAQASKKKKVRRKVEEAKVFIQASFNNTIITVADQNGNVLSWATAGGSGFRGSRKSTPYAAQIASRKACERAADYAIERVVVVVNGPGPGRESAVRELSNFYRVMMISDVTGIPHNGCRAEKERRV